MCPLIYPAPGLGVSMNEIGAGDGSRRAACALAVRYRPIPLTT